MEELKLALFYSTIKCTDGYIALVGCQALDDDSIYMILGIGMSLVGWKALQGAKKSAASFTGANIDLIELFPLPSKISWQLPDQDFENMDKIFHEL
jgi:hypothetical protein